MSGAENTGNAKHRAKHATTDTQSDKPRNTAVSNANAKNPPPPTYGSCSLTARATRMAISTGRRWSADSFLFSIQCVLEPSPVKAKHSSVVQQERTCTHGPRQTSQMPVQKQAQLRVEVAIKTHTSLQLAQRAILELQPSQRLHTHKSADHEQTYSTGSQRSRTASTAARDEHTRGGCSDQSARGGG